MPYIRTGSPDDLVLNRSNELVLVRGRGGDLRLLTTEDVRRRLGYAHARHIYWLVEQGHLPYRKFGRELVFTEQDVAQFWQGRGY